MTLGATAQRSPYLQPGPRSRRPGGPPATPGDPPPGPSPNGGAVARQARGGTRRPLRTHFSPQSGAPRVSRGPGWRRGTGTLTADPPRSSWRARESARGGAGRPWKAAAPGHPRSAPRPPQPTRACGWPPAARRAARAGQCASPRKPALPPRPGLRGAGRVGAFQGLRRAQRRGGPRPTGQGAAGAGPAPPRPQEGDPRPPGTRPAPCAHFLLGACGLRRLPPASAPPPPSRGPRRVVGWGDRGRGPRPRGAAPAGLHLVLAASPRPTRGAAWRRLPAPPPPSLLPPSARRPPRSGLCWRPRRGAPIPAPRWRARRLLAPGRAPGGRLPARAPRTCPGTASGDRGGEEPSGWKCRFALQKEGNFATQLETSATRDPEGDQTRDSLWL